LKHSLLIAKALSDPTRLRILCALRSGEVCVCQIQAMLGVAASTVSRHLGLLEGAGLLESRREGRWMHYRLPDEAEGSAAAEAIAWVHRWLGDDAQIRRDAERLRVVLCVVPEELFQLLSAQGACCDLSVCCPPPGERAENPEQSTDKAIIRGAESS